MYSSHDTSLIFSISCTEFPLDDPQLQLKRKAKAKLFSVSGYWTLHLCKSVIFMINLASSADPHLFVKRCRSTYTYSTYSCERAFLLTCEFCRKYKKHSMFIYSFVHLIQTLVITNNLNKVQK